MVDERLVAALVLDAIAVLLGCELADQPFSDIDAHLRHADRVIRLYTIGDLEDLVGQQLAVDLLRKSVLVPKLLVSVVAQPPEMVLLLGIPGSRQIARTLSPLAIWPSSDINLGPTQRRHRGPVPIGERSAGVCRPRSA